MKFEITINQGAVKLKTPDKFKKFLITLEGQKCDLTLEKYKVGRTLQQLRYLWGIVYPLLSDHTGHEITELT